MKLKGVQEIFLNAFFLNLKQNLNILLLTNKVLTAKRTLYYTDFHKNKLNF